MDTDDTFSAALAECLQRLERGDLSARDRIIELCSDRLHALAHRMLGRYPGVRRWEDTDDVFQNAAMRLHRALGDMQLETPRSIMALAATQLHRELIDLARRHAGPSSYAANHGTNVMPLAAADDGPNQYIDHSPSSDTNLDRWTLFHEAIGNLPDEEREVFHLVWYLGADQKTIATLMNCSERTVKSRWRSAREAVRAELEGKPPQP
jgi:RNA polymerase sigma-70 factor (ECF subfamily)